MHNRAEITDTMIMKKTEKLRSAFCVGALTLLFAFPMQKSSLKEIAKPYLGVYECKSATFDGEEYLGYVKRVELELKKGGECALYWQEKGGAKHQLQGKYTYDDEKKTIRFFWQTQRELKQSFLIKEGKIVITHQIGDKLLNVTFEQK